MASLSAIILTRNEAHNIEDCIKSCLFADEVLVIDDNSTDETVALAQATSPKVKVVNHALNSDWAQQRNFAMTIACGDYFLFVDADERITESLRLSIQKNLETSPSNVFCFKRVISFVEGQPRHGIFSPDIVTRLFPKNSGKFERPVHERFVTDLKSVKISGEMEHNTYHDWDAYWKKFDSYTKISAENYLKTGKNVSFVRDIVLRPFWAFFRIYIINRGFLDGKLGWVFAVYHYVYTMTKYVRLYSLVKHHGRI